MKELSFILDVCPFVGGVKMLIEAIFKKDMTGTSLEGKARGMHFLFAIISLVLDFSTGIGGSIARIFAKGFLKRFAVKVGGEAAGKAVTRVAENRAGRLVINSTEKRIKKKAEDLVHDTGGYRSNSKKRDEIREKYGANIQNNEDNNNFQNSPQPDVILLGKKIQGRVSKLGRGSKENIKSDDQDEEREQKIEQQKRAKENRSKSTPKNNEEYSGTEHENRNPSTYANKKKAYASFVGDFGRQNNSSSQQPDRDTIIRQQRVAKENRPQFKYIKNANSPESKKAA